VAWDCRDLHRLDIVAYRGYVHFLAGHSPSFLETSPSGLAPLSISGPLSGPLYNVDGFTCGISKSWQVAHMLLYFLPVRTPQPWQPLRPDDPKSYFLRRSSRQSFIRSFS
jgi:hypothetical protein